MKKEIDSVHYASYLEGMKDAWRLAKTIVTMPIGTLRFLGFDAKADDEFEYSCEVIEMYDILDVMCKLSSNDELRIGDEVVGKKTSSKFFVTDVHDIGDDDYSTFIDGISCDGKVYCKEDLNNWVRTGKTINDYKMSEFKFFNAHFL